MPRLFSGSVTFARGPLARRCSPRVIVFKAFPALRLLGAGRNTVGLEQIGDDAQVVLRAQTVLPGAGMVHFTREYRSPTL